LKQFKGDTKVKKELIPKPQSAFVRVKCGKCGNEQIVFNKCSITVKCNVCDEVLAEPSGSKAKIRGEIVQVLG
jgi:small subunit ribosomal protein S27e